MPTMVQGSPTADAVQARRFVDGWLMALNGRDAAWLSDAFSENAVFTSPLAARLLPECDGILRGKAKIAAYWSAAVERFPDLSFTLIDIFLGVDALVINYGNQRGQIVNEVLLFDGPLIREGHATHSDQSPPWVSQLRRIAGAVPSF